MKANVISLSGEEAGSIDLKDEIYGLEPRMDLIHRMVTYQLAKRRAGTHRAKERNDVNGSTRKIVKQKGSGGARHGNRKAPQFRGGGKAHGPKVRSHAFDMNKKVRKLALIHALSQKAKDEGIFVLDTATMTEPKTKGLVAAMAKLGLTNALIIDGPEIDKNFQLAARNIPNIDVLLTDGINVYDILRRTKLVLTKAAVAQIEARLS